MISQRTSEVAPELSNPPASASGTDSGDDKGSHSPPSPSSHALSLPSLSALEGGGLAAVLHDTPPAEHKEVGHISSWDDLSSGGLKQTFIEVIWPLKAVCPFLDSHLPTHDSSALLQETGGGGTLENIVVQTGGQNNPQEPPLRQQSQPEDKGEGSLPAP